MMVCVVELSLFEDDVVVVGGGASTVDDWFL